jgi:hypothetical protein
MTVAKHESNKVTRDARLKWVPISLMKIPPTAQRDLNNARVEHLAAEFDLEQLGTPTVNHRESSFYLIDGQHRIEALKRIGWGDQQVQCWTYEDLSEQQEAERFLKLNNVLPVQAFDRFRIGVHAGRAVECDIDRIVRAQDLRVSQDHIDGAVSAVGTLRRIYVRSNGPTLGRTLRIIRDAYGSAGLEAPVLDGIGLLCQRYNGRLDDVTTVTKLSNAHGGVNGLLNKAENLRRQTGNQRAHCVAAAAVELINSGRGGKKLPSWWSLDVTS